MLSLSSTRLTQDWNRTSWTDFGVVNAETVFASTTAATITRALRLPVL